MSAATRTPYSVVRPVAERLVVALAPCCERIELAAKTPDYSILKMMVELLPRPPQRIWTMQQRDDWIAAMTAIAKLYISVVIEPTESSDGR